MEPEGRDHHHDHEHDHDEHEHEHELPGKGASDRFSALEATRVRAQLKQLFDGFPQPLVLLLFSDPKKNPTYAQACRQVIKGLSDLSDKIILQDLPMDHELAGEHGVAASPTMVFAPGRFRARWQGAPVGEEGSSFLETAIMLGYGQSALGPQAKKVLAELDGPRRIKVFVSPTCPYCPAQIINGLKAAVERPDLVETEIIDIQANRDLAEKYDAFSTPTVYANEKLLAKGAQSEELFAASLAALEQQNVFIPDNDAEEIACDLVIVGGGPAGLTAAIYSARNGLKSVLVEKGPLGGQVATTPVVENYPGFTSVGGKTLVDIMAAHALEYANLLVGEEAVEIKPGNPIVVTTSRRRFTCRAVLLATGASHRKLKVPGEERLAGRGVSYCSTCDGPLFKGKKALVIGGGDSAATEAINLANIGVATSLVHRRDSLRAQEHLARGLAASGVKLMFDCEIRDILGEKRVEAVRLFDKKAGADFKLATDAVFVAIGYSPLVGLATKAGVELTPAGYIARDAHHRTNQPGIYCAGDVEGGYKQIVTAAGQGAEAALSIFQDLVKAAGEAKAS